MSDTQKGELCEGWGCKHVYEKDCEESTCHARTLTLTRDDYTLIENWYDWYLNSPGGKWANGADTALLEKLKGMFND